VVVMSNVSSQRVFDIDFSCILVPNYQWGFYADGTITPEDKKRFFEEYIQCSDVKPSEALEMYEKDAAEEIAKILKAEAEWIPETEEEQKARWVKEKKNATEKYLSEVADLKEALHNRMNN
jgi:Ser-tRNA(Ala) deacylase AlaX